MSEKRRIIIIPAVAIDHDRQHYNLEVELPGVKKGDVKLDISERTFCVSGTRDEVELYGCYYLAHPVNVEEASANFEDGLLKVTIPLTHSFERKSIKIK